ncbi:MAG TPA: outer membrane protein assembly factor BamA [Candidatus Eisenbacteria bacterium]|nr:outer membrane protein assembly factor BamA [Candidatus Eisenbacteria bacterium]
MLQAPALRAAAGAGALFFLLAGGPIGPARAQETAPSPLAPPDSLAAPPDSLGAPPERLGAPASAGSIAAVRAAGFANVDSIVVIRTFGVSAGDPYTAARVSDGVRRLYATGLFTDVSVTEEAGPAGMVLTVSVRERPRILGITFSGQRKLEEKTLREKLTVADGQLLDPSVLDLDSRKIADAYAQEGYARAQVAADLDSAGPGLVSVRFDIQEGEKQKVRSIVIHGARDLPAEELAKSMKSETPGFLKSGTYKPAHLEEDMTELRLYMRSRGYRDADVDSIRPVDRPDGKGVDLHVHLREGPRYRFGTMAWEGNTAVPKEALEYVTQCREGMPYNESQVQKTLQSAYELYQETGYLFLSIDPQFSDRDTIVDIRFVVQEGARSRVADLRIVGNTRTRENVIRREATVHPGDVFRRSTLIRTQRDIFGLGFFQDVQVDYQPTGDSADINLTLKVQEKQTGTASAGAGYSSQTGLTGFLELGHNNLFGRGQSIAIRLERGGRRRDLQLSFTEPWYRDTPLSIGFDVFNTQRELDFYERKDVGGGIRFGRPLPWPDYSRGVIGYDLRDVSLSEFDDFREGEPVNLQRLRDTEWPRRVSSVSLTFSRNSTDNPFFPARGSRLTWINTLAGGPLGGVEKFLKESFELRTYSRLQKPFTLMLRTKAGFLTGGSVPDYERFRLGGTTSDYLRGYPDYYVVPRANITRNPATGTIIERYPGGRTMLILSTELHFPIADPLRGLLFFDAGNTWNSTRDLDLGDLRKGAGIGFRLEVPALGRVGFDIGYGFDREEGGSWETHFQLGNTF